jgi:hypothetical protein
MERIMDHTSFIGAFGTILSISLNQVNTFVSLLIGITTLIYMILKVIEKLRKDKPFS